MKIEHIAIWVNDLEGMKSFYCAYFDMKCGKKYVNEKKHFTSYFLSFPEGARLELMHRPDIIRGQDLHNAVIGMAHLAISVGSKAKVNLLTAQLKLDGFEVKGHPRTTGDGYFESVVIDPEGNSIEITK